MIAGGIVNRLGKAIGRRLAAYLNRPIRGYELFAVSDPHRLAKVLQPADVLLVEGDRRISTAIKYLTQSTWSHAALYVGETIEPGAPADSGRRLVEADIEDGVIAVPLAKYAELNTRICRPVGLTPEDQAAVVDYVIARIGHHYDLKNVIDLARYLLPTPPVPVHWRRRMIALGSGDPTRAICSTLIAQAFQSVRYPILPRIQQLAAEDPRQDKAVREILHIRHYSLFTPRDFDISPFFETIKPTIALNFNYRELNWADPG